MLGRVKAIVTDRSTDVIECYVNPSGTIGSHVSINFTTLLARIINDNYTLSFDNIIMYMLLYC